MVSMVPFYVYALSTAATAVMSLLFSLKLLADYRRELKSAVLCLSLFFLSFSLNQTAMLLRLSLGYDLLFSHISNIFGPVALIFIASFAISLLWPGRERLGFAVTIPLCSFFFLFRFFVEREVVEFYPGVSEVIYPLIYVIVTIFTVTAIGFFVSAVFIVYAIRVRWSSLRRGGIMMASGFMLIAVFTYLLDWPGLLGFLLPLSRFMAAAGVLFVYLGARKIRTSRAPSFL